MASISSRREPPPSLQNTTEMRATPVAEDTAPRVSGDRIRRTETQTAAWNAEPTRSARSRPAGALRIDSELVRSVLGGIGGGVIAAMIVLVSSIAIALAKGLDPFTVPKLFVLNLVGKTAMLPHFTFSTLFGTAVLFWTFGLLGAAVGWFARWLPVSLAVPLSGIVALVAWLLQRVLVWPLMPPHYLAHFDAFVPAAATFLQALATGLTIGVGVLIARMPPEYFRPGRYVGDGPVRRDPLPV